MQAIFKTSSLKSENRLCAEYFLANSVQKVHKKMLFLDRDGVINKDLNYVHTLDQTILIEDAIYLMQKATTLNIGISVISNQAGVAHGLYTESELITFSTWLLDSKLGSLDVTIDSFWYCPSHPQGEVVRYRINCLCRKPGNLLLESASAFHEIQPSELLFVGDKESDALAAYSSKIKYVDVSNPAWVDLVDEFLNS